MEQKIMIRGKQGKSLFMEIIVLAVVVFVVGVVWTFATKGTLPFTGG